MKNTLLFCSIVSVLLLPTFGFSQSSKVGNLSGQVAAGIVLVDNADNLSPNGSNSTISNLESSPQRRLTTIPALLPEATYKFGESDQFAWYFKTTPPIDEAGGFVLASGLSYDITGLAVIEPGVFLVPFAEVWKNPYLVNASRQETDVAAWGAQLACNHILGSEFWVKFAFLSEDVQDDELTMLYPELARDGIIYDIALGYGFFKGSAFPLRTQLSLLKGAYDGDSNSFFKVKAELSGSYAIGRVTIVPSIQYSHKDYDATDPVFDTTRRENGYGGSLVVQYEGLLNIPSLSLQGITGYSRGEANINFYDTEALFGGLGIVYRY